MNTHLEIEYKQLLTKEIYEQIKDEHFKNCTPFTQTNNYFTDAAIKCAKDVKSKIVLIDGEQLCKYMIEYNLGVTTRHVYEIKQVDRDYFEE